MTSPQPIIPSSSRKDRSIELLNDLREAITNEDIPTAAKKITALNTLIMDWQRSYHITAARDWLEKALQGDLLTFNADEAKQYLKHWEESIQQEHNTELEHYRSRVEDRIQRKRDALQVRGVIAHCDELIATASTLERGEEPPHPDFVFTNYYTKAQDIARTAQKEYSDNAEVDILVQRMERTYNNKMLASRIFKTALEDSAYTQAIRDLQQLKDTMLIPRFRIIANRGVASQLTFDGMISTATARQELEALARTWAQTQANQTIQTTQEYLDSHAPNAAVESLQDRNTYTQFLEPDLLSQLQTIANQAEAEQRSLQLAETKAEEAIAMAEKDPVGAWNRYAEAYHTYQWAETLSKAREAIITQMEKDLQQLSIDVEMAFNDRQMDRVQQMAQRANTIYSNKDDKLDILLRKIADFNEMALEYNEYVNNAAATLKQINEILWEDSVGANDLLTQLESYPDIVLEAFPDLHQVRIHVNERLNADQTYNQLYGALFNPEFEETKHAMQDASRAANEYETDNRFVPLVQALQLHLTYITALRQRDSGNIDKARALLQGLANATNHPDQESAQQILSQLQSSSAAE